MDDVHIYYTHVHYLFSVVVVVVVKHILLKIIMHCLLHSNILLKNQCIYSIQYVWASSYQYSLPPKKKKIFNRILLNCKGALFSTHKMKRMSLGYTKTTSADKTASIWGWMVCVCIKRSNIHGISIRKDRICTVNLYHNYNIGIHKCTFIVRNSKRNERRYRWKKNKYPNGDIEDILNRRMSSGFFLCMYICMV